MAEGLQRKVVDGEGAGQGSFFFSILNIYIYPFLAIFPIMAGFDLREISRHGALSRLFARLVEAVGRNGCGLVHSLAGGFRSSFWRTGAKLR